MKKLVSLLLCAALFMGLLPARADEYVKFSHTFFDTFDTVITIIGYAKDKKVFDAAAEDAENEFIRLHRLFDQYHGYEGINNVYTVNREAAKQPVKVDPVLFNMLLFCKETQPKLRNTANIAMGKVLDLWHEAREQASDDPEKASLPDETLLKEAALHMDMDKVILNKENLTVYFEDPEITLNVGAVAKGYAAELVAQRLLKGPMPSFIVNAGGNVRTGHPPLDGRTDWGVSIQDPDALFSTSSPGVTETLLVHDLSIVTSGDYQRYFTVNGERYHHLISPETLFPARHMRSVTVLTEDSGLADLLSTTLFLLPVEEGREFLKDFPDVAALWVLNDRTIQMTDNMKPYALSQREN